MLRHILSSTMAAISPQALTALSLDALNKAGDEKLTDQLVLMIGLVPFLIIILVIAALLVAAYWKIFTKAGQPGWAAIIPIYNFIILLRIIQKPWWWIFLFFIPFVGSIMGIVLIVYLGRVFGKGVGFIFGMIFLNFIFLPILAFGKSEYQYGFADAREIQPPYQPPSPQNPSGTMPPQYPPPVPPPTQ